MTEPRDVTVFLDDIVENLRLAASFASETSAEEIASDRKTLYAIVRALEVAGEAAKKIPDDVRAHAPDLPWREMSGMRDRLIHAYRDVDVELVWQTATVDAPRVESALRGLRERIGADHGSPKDR